MTSFADESIGPYTVVRELGRGGMGVVYLGRDTRLDRDVAIKALPAHLAEDPDRLSRFEREAKTLAQLSHPNVAGIHGVEEHEGARYLVLEYVEGETLAERLDRGALPVDEALEIAVQIAAGVEAAHDAGVIHRDLKPGNVIVTPDGKAKVLDFGLARAEEASSSATPRMSPDSPTITSPAIHSPTMPGVILGTAAYMSPEQARGRKVDKRTDIWSFGVILYEMLTGASPFIGETVSDSIGAVLHKDVDVDRLPAATPPMVRHVLHRCLERDKAQRYRDIGDVGIELDASESDRFYAAESESGRSAAPLLWLYGAVLVLAIALVVSLVSRPNAAPAQRAMPVELSLTPTEGIAFTIASNRGWAELSPDGRWVVVPVATPEGSGLWLRSLETGKGRMLPEATDGFYPFWSPDSRWVAFFTRGLLQKVEIDGGLPVPICVAEWGRGGSWHPNGRIVFTGSSGGPLSIVQAAGGEPVVITQVDGDRGETAHYWPRWLPDGERLVYFIRSGRREVQGIYLGRVPSEGLDTARERVVASSSSGVLAQYPSGLSILWVEDGKLLARSFDEVEGAVGGPTSRIAAGVRVLSSQRASMISVSNTGTVTWASTEYGQSQLAWVSREGRVESVVGPKTSIHQPTMSPDGKTVAFVVVVEGQGDIWLLDVANRQFRALTSSPDYDEQATWSPDSTELFHKTQMGDEFTFIRRRIDGSGQPKTLRFAGANLRFDRVSSWLKNGLLILDRIADDGTLDLGVLSADGGDDQQYTPLIEQRGNQHTAVASPDSGALAFIHETSAGAFARVGVLTASDGNVTLAPNVEQVPLNGVSRAAWSGDGTKLWCSTSAREMYEIPVDRSGGGARLGKAELLFSFAMLTPNVDFAALPTGERFLMVVQPDSGQQPIHVLQNWQERLERPAP